MDLDAMRRVAEMLSEGGTPEPEHVAVDQAVTQEEVMDDLGYPRELAGRDLAMPARGEILPEERDEAISDEAISDEDLAALIKQEIDQAAQALEQENNNRDLAMQYYFGEQPAQTSKKRSSVVSKDVADVIEAMLAQVLQAFVGQEIAQFPPANQADEEQAGQESAYCNWVFFQDCGGSSLLYSTLKDALQRALCVGKVYWERKTRVLFDEYRDLVPQEVAQALQPRQEGEQVDVVGYEPGEPRIVPPNPLQAQLSMVYGRQPPQAQQIETVSLRIRRRRQTEKPKIVAVDCGDFFFDGQHTSLLLEDVRFCGERRILTQSDLLDMDFDAEQIEMLPTYSGTSQIDTVGRSRDKHSSQPYQQESDKNRAGRPIEVWECYYLVDRDGDGFAERVKVFWASDQLLRDSKGNAAEEVDAVPYALGCPFPTPHRVIGESVFNKIKHVQDVKTEMLRLAIDNSLATTFGRYEVEYRNVHLGDFAAPQPGGYVRSRKIGSVAPIPIATVGSIPIDLMSYMDRIRSEGAGPALDMQKENLPVNVATAHGTERVMTAMEQLVSRIAESYATTFLSEIFRLLHNLLMRHGKGELTAPLTNGTYLSTDPRNWRERERVTISIGKTQAERARMATSLSVILGHQTQMLQGGGDGILVDLPRIHNTLIDLGRAFALPSPDQYWIDPASQEAQQALNDKAMKAQQQAQQQAQYMQMLLQVQKDLQAMQEETKRLKAQLDFRSKTADTAVKADQHTKDQALELTKLEVTAQQEADRQYRENLGTMT